MGKVKIMREWNTFKLFVQGLTYIIKKKSHGQLKFNIGKQTRFCFWPLSAPSPPSETSVSGQTRYHGVSPKSWQANTLLPARWTFYCAMLSSKLLLPSPWCFCTAVCIMVTWWLLKNIQKVPCFSCSSSVSHVYFSWFKDLITHLSMSLHYS